MGMAKVPDHRLHAAGRDERSPRTSSPRPCSSSTSAAWSRGPARVRAWATSSWPTSARPTPSSSCCGPSRTTTCPVPPTRSSTCGSSRSSCPGRPRDRSRTRSRSGARRPRSTRDWPDEVAALDAALRRPAEGTPLYRSDLDDESPGSCCGRTSCSPTSRCWPSSTWARTTSTRSTPRSAPVDRGVRRPRRGHRHVRAARGRGRPARRRRAGRDARGASASARARCPASCTPPTSCSGCAPSSPPGRRRPGPGPSGPGPRRPQCAGVIHTDFQRGFIRAEMHPLGRAARGRLVVQGPRRRQAPRRGQGLRGRRRRRHGVPLQRLSRRDPVRPAVVPGARRARSMPPCPNRRARRRSGWCATSEVLATLEVADDRRGPPHGAARPGRHRGRAAPAPGPVGAHLRHALPHRRGPLSTPTCRVLQGDHDGAATGSVCPVWQARGVIECEAGAFARWGVRRRRPAGAAGDRPPSCSSAPPSATSATCRPAPSRSSAAPTPWPARTPAAPAACSPTSACGRPVLLVVNDHTEAGAVADVLARLDRGERVAVVSDAGMPGISDPGERLVAAASAAGHRVEVVPGPSAALAGLVASGLPTGRFVFEGFLPRKGSGRTERLAAVAAERRTVVLYEAPAPPGPHARRPGRGLRRPPAGWCWPGSSPSSTRRCGGAASPARSSAARRSSPGASTCWCSTAPPSRRRPTTTPSGPPSAVEKGGGATTRDAVSSVAAALGVPRRRVYDLAVSG